MHKPAGDPPENAPPRHTATISGRARRQRRDGAPPLLKAGDVLAGRYRILAFIAAGGMGEVYAAFDEELQSRIAVKALLPDVTEQKTLDRFRAEIQLARKVTHPNACRLFDLGYHQLPDRASPIAFLTMELVEGPTLSQRIKKGRIPVEEARRIVRQMANALHAAHEAGVIHRDFKSSNVLLRAVPDASRGVRAVVTDFGLALPDDASNPDGDVVMGTPEYMAPEQLMGQPLTFACDLYALGVVMFEMVTGELPFPTDNPYLRCEEDAPSAKSKLPELPDAWASTIARLLARKPADRFASALEVAAAVDDGTPPTRPTVRRRRAPWWIAGAATAAAGVTGAMLLRSRPPAPPSVAKVAEPAPAPRPVKRRRVVAVLGFKNLADRADAAWISTALEEMLSTEIAAGDDLRVIPPDSVARMRLELGLHQGERLPPSVLQRVRRHIGADLVVDGAYFAAPGGKKVRVDLRLQETNAGETLLADSETGAPDELFELVSRAGGRLREKLGAGQVAARDLPSVRASLPASPEAARLYAEGLVELRKFEPLKARDLLEKAAAVEPRHPFIHSSLSQAWAALGYMQKARDEAQRAFTLAASLPRADRLNIEGRYRETSADWDQAIRIYQSLFSFFPDDLDYGLRLAQVQTASGHGEEALKTIQLLRQLPAPACDDPAIDLAEANASETLSDFKRERAAAAVAVDKGKKLSADLLVARARIAEGAALWGLGDPKASLAAYHDAERIATQAGARFERARALQQEANDRVQQGDAGAKQLFEDALAIYRELGDRRGEAGALSGIASIVSDDDPQKAIQLYQQALEADRAMGDLRRIAVELNNVAVSFEQLRRLEQAGKNFQEAAQTFRKAGYLSAAGSALSNLALNLLNRGDLDGARDTVEEALQILRPTDSQADLAWASTALGQVLRAAGDRDGARRRLEQAMKVNEKIDSPGDVAFDQALLARFALDDDDAVGAEKLARQAAATASGGKSPPNEAWAWAIAAESALAQHRLADAQQALAQAKKLQPANADPDHALSLILAEARVNAGQAARTALEQELARARRDGYVYHQYLIRLARIESGFANDAESLSDEARARGFTLVASRAKALAKKTR